jgi:hypothetical protein
MIRISQSKLRGRRDQKGIRRHRPFNGTWKVNEIFCSHCVYATRQVSSVSILDLLGLIIKVTALLIYCLYDFARNVQYKGTFTL